MSQFRQASFPPTFVQGSRDMFIDPAGDALISVYSFFLGSPSHLTHHHYKIHVHDDNRMCAMVNFFDIPRESSSSSQSSSSTSSSVPHTRSAPTSQISDVMNSHTSSATSLNLFMQVVVRIAAHPMAVHWGQNRATDARARHILFPFLHSTSVSQTSSEIPSQITSTTSSSHHAGESSG